MTIDVKNVLMVAIILTIMGVLFAISQQDASINHYVKRYQEGQKTNKEDDYCMNWPYCINIVETAVQFCGPCQKAKLEMSSVMRRKK